MKARLLSWGALICLIVLTGLLMVHALAIFPGITAIRWFLARSAAVIGRIDAPAWVQAVGSIVAIFAAIGIAMWQRRNDRQHAHERALAAAAIAGVKVQTMLWPLWGALLGEQHSYESSASYGGRERVKSTVLLYKGFQLPNDEQLMALHEVIPTAAKDIAVGCGTLGQTIQYLEMLLTKEDQSDDWFEDRFKECRGRFKRSEELLGPASFRLNQFIATLKI